MPFRCRRGWPCVLLVLMLGIVLSAQEVETAQAPVESWLKLIDTEQYTASWENAASGFKAAIPQEKWTAAVAAVRGGVGALKSRELKSVTHKAASPGAPAGEYVIFQFSAAFEKKAAVTELVSAVKEIDGSWRVAGYSIK